MGFRGTHADAVAVQRLVGSRAEVACFEDVELVLLGDLGGAEDPLRATVLTYLSEGGNMGRPLENCTPIATPSSSD
jgi:hypothetical protein